MNREYYLTRYEEELASAAAAETDTARIAHKGLAQLFKRAADRLDEDRLNDFEKREPTERDTR